LKPDGGVHLRRPCRTSSTISTMAATGSTPTNSGVHGAAWTGSAASSGTSTTGRWVGARSATLGVGVRTAAGAAVGRLSDVSLVAGALYVLPVNHTSFVSKSTQASSRRLPPTSTVLNTSLPVVRPKIATAEGAAQ